jgi:periplasmic divalent cation tolerance protein
MDIVLVLTTVPNAVLAETIASALIEARLAACVNVLAPMTSVYHWEGRIQRDEELQIVIKTTRDRIQAIEAKVGELHTYELPELLVVSVEGGSERYLKWVRAESAERGSAT